MKRIAFLLLIILLLLAGCSHPGTEKFETGTPVTPVNKPAPGTETWQQHGQIPYSEMENYEIETINFIRGNTEYGELLLREAITIGDTCYYGVLLPVYDAGLKNAEQIGVLSAEPCEMYTTPLQHLQTTFNKEKNVKLCRGELPDYTTPEGKEDFYLVYENGRVQRFHCDTSYPPYYDDGRWIIAPITVSYEGLSPAERNALYTLYTSGEVYSGETMHLNSRAIRVGDTCYFGWIYTFGAQIFPEDLPKDAKHLGKVSGTCTSFTTPTEDLQINFDISWINHLQPPDVFIADSAVYSPNDTAIPCKTVYLVFDSDYVLYFMVDTTETPAYYDANRWMAAPAWLPR